MHHSRHDPLPSPGAPDAGRELRAEAEQMVEQIAEIAHEANRAYRTTLGDNHHVSWLESPRWLREGVKQGVRDVLDGSAETPRELHARWRAAREARGWRYGPVRDEVARTHPGLVDWDELPDHERRKDHLFRAVVLALSEAV